MEAPRHSRFVASALRLKHTFVFSLTGAWRVGLAGLGGRAHNMGRVVLQLGVCLFLGVNDPSYISRMGKPVVVMVQSVFTSALSVAQCVA
jgi:hypothetical protein